MRKALLAGLAAALALSCGPSFVPQYLVKDLRILAARGEVISETLDSADADAGDTVRLSALVANPEGLTGLTVHWYTCLPQPGVSVSVCEDQRLLSDPSVLASDPNVLDLGEGESIDLTVPGALAPALQALLARAAQQPAYACHTYLELPVVIVAKAGSERQMALKRVRLVPYHAILAGGTASRYVRNSNPAFYAVRADPPSEKSCSGGALLWKKCTTSADCSGSSCTAGICAAAPPSGQHILCGQLVDGSRGIYRSCNPDGSFIDYYEDLEFQWYVTGGSFSRQALQGFDNGNETEQRPLFTAPGSPFTMWVIIRDGRGGEDWARQDFP